MYMFKYIYIYTYIHMYIYIYWYMSVYVYTHTYYKPAKMGSLLLGFRWDISSSSRTVWRRSGNNVYSLRTWKLPLKWWCVFHEKLCFFHSDESVYQRIILQCSKQPDCHTTHISASVCVWYLDVSCLVVSTPLKNMKLNWDDDIPNWMEKCKMFQTTNHCYMYHKQ